MLRMSKYFLPTVKKTTSFVIFISLIFTCFVLPAGAETVEWDGKTPLIKGNTYLISSELRVTKDFTIPEGATLNVPEGGRLILTKNVQVKINGHLAVSIGGTLELKSGEIEVKKNAKMSIYGEFLHYVGAKLNVYSEAQLLFYNKSNCTISGVLNIYPEATFINRGYVVMTRLSVSTLTGNAENTKNAQLHLQGTFSITKSGTLTNKGYMTVGSNGTVTNSGLFVLVRGSGYNRFGSVKNTVNGVFNDFRDTFDFEEMTVSTLVDEPNIKSYGIDVSFAQGDIDWEKVAKSNIDFALIRAARGNANTPMKEDDYFRKNIKGAMDNGLDVGVYFYSYATTVAEARAEALFFVEVIKGYELTYPVVLDMEENLKKQGISSVKRVTDMVEAFFEVLMENGYYPMLYSFKSWFEEYLDMTILDKYAIWLAQWNDEVTYQGGYYIWQYTNVGRVNGINGDVDINISYRDFPDILRRYRLNNLR